MEPFTVACTYHPTGWEIALCVIVCTLCVASGFALHWLVTRRS